MFDSLSEKLRTTFQRLTGRGVLTEADIDEAMKEIRSALIDADVNLKVTKEFCENVRKKAVGKEVMKSLEPGQVVVKHVYDELVRALGTHEPLNLRFAPPVVIMLVGLQGSGKTTTCGKLARYLREDLKRRPLLVPADIYRPAAIDQLMTVGKSIGIDVYPSTVEQKPLQIAQAAMEFARKAGFDTVILDTAGRLQIDDKLMDELVEIVDEIEPHEILLAVDAMTGQEAANVAKGFDERLDIDGVILTKLDGDARGGAALSMRHTLGKPIKFTGLGEKLDALDVFYPDRMASRILGMGDVLSLIEKASKEVSADDAKKLQRKLKRDEFTLEDFHSQLQTIKRMGSISSLMQMVPGMGQVAKSLDDDQVQKQFGRTEAMILSMTKAERQDPDLIDGSRRKRIALGSGNSVEELNKFLKQFYDMKKMMKKFSKLDPGKLRNTPGFSDLMKGGGLLRGGNKFPGL